LFFLLKNSFLIRKTKKAAIQIVVVLK